MNQTDKSPRQRANAEGAREAMQKEIEENFRENDVVFRISYEHDGEVRRGIRAARAVLGRRTKALGLRVEHRCQRREDGSYTILIQLLPEDVGIDVGGIDGIVVNESRGFMKAGR